MKNKIKKVLVFIILLICVTSAWSQNPASGSWTGIDAYTAQYMKQWNIPGMAVVVIKNDSVIFKKSMGYTDINTQKPVNSKTLFSIGSITKQFTSTALLLLQDETKINLEKPVVDYYPAFRLSDSMLQSSVTLKDILSHRTGLERGDHIFYNAEYSRAEILERLKYLKPVAPLRNNFIYNNLMYTVAGTVIEKASGQRYEDFVTQKLLIPLGMRHSFYGLPGNDKNYALPYSLIGGRLKQLQIPNLTGVEPAGGIWADIDDMGLWLKFMLNKGKWDTTRLLSAKSARLLQTPVLFTGNGMRPDETEYKSYGLGFGFSAYKGSRVMYHTGVSGGYIAHIAMMPEENIGIVLLANIETYTNGFINNLFDRALNKEQTDWNSSVLKVVKQQQAADSAERESSLQLVIKRSKIDSAFMYEGKFLHNTARPLEVLVKNNSLTMVFNGHSYPMVKDAPNSFWAYDEEIFGKMKIIFSTTALQSIAGLRFSYMGETLEYNKSN